MRMENESAKKGDPPVTDGIRQPLYCVRSEPDNGGSTVLGYIQDTTAPHGCYHRHAGHLNADELSN
jgi:hypothetical protein